MKRDPVSFGCFLAAAAFPAQVFEVAGSYAGAAPWALVEDPDAWRDEIELGERAAARIDRPDPSTAAAETIQAFLEAEIENLRRVNPALAERVIEALWQQEVA